MKRKHSRYMLKAIELAKKAKGKTYPNPLVGALIVKKGKIISSGYHRKAGAAHAEIVALRKAGKRARGAELYVTLEPCAHYGRTPPCVNSIVKNRIKKVYVAMRDPNPLVNRRGINLLRKNGIDVEVGICRREASKLNRFYIRRIKHQKCLPVSLNRRPA